MTVPFHVPVVIVPTVVIDNALILLSVSLPVLVPDWPVRYVWFMAVPCHVPVPIVPTVVTCAEPVHPSSASGVTAVLASVPVFVSAIVASSTRPETVVLAVGKYPAPMALPFHTPVTTVPRVVT